MVVNPKTGNTFISAMRGSGRRPRRCCSGWMAPRKIDLIALDQVRYTRIGLPNPPPAETPLVLGERKIPVANYPDKVDPAGLMGVQTITHMAFVDGKLYVSGLSSEEFASRMRVIPYPFEIRGQRRERRDLSRLARAAGNLLAGVHLRPVHDRRGAVHRRQLSLHAAGQVPGVGICRLAAKCRARRLPSSAIATGRST